MITLGTLFTGSAYAMRGGEKKKEQGPPINATSKDEEQFIQYVIEDHDNESRFTNKQAGNS